MEQYEKKLLQQHIIWF